MDDIISLGSDSDQTYSSADTSTDIFYIYRPSAGSAPATEQFPGWLSTPDKIKIADKRLRKRSRSRSEVPGSYVKHSNLDTQELSLTEQIHLRLVHYLTIANAVRVLLIVLCFGWFLFNACTVFHDYLRHESTVFMEFRSPKNTLPPAITICTDNVIVK